MTDSANKLPENLKRIVSIHGAPRSGTSWLGQIMNSHPDTAYRYQPLFAYKFKDRIGSSSSRAEIYEFLAELYHVDDEFILNRREVESGIYPDFTKNPAPGVMVMKMVRYHHLIGRLLDKVSELKAVGIIRHPCAVINSWLNAPREFDPEWDRKREWRKAASKNRNRPEEFYGFDRWKELAGIMIGLEESFPERFMLLRYEYLVENPFEESENLMNFCGLDMREQVKVFLKASREKHLDDPYAVYKKPSVKDRWKDELEKETAEAILSEVKDTELERFTE